MKKIIKFLFILLPWFISTLTPVDKSYYLSLNLPFFAPPPFFFAIIWTILYILIATTIYQKIDMKKDIQAPYKYTLIINYIANQSFQPLFFLLKNNFLSFVSCIITFLSSLFLYKESQNNKLLIPYILFSLFATILSLTIYLMNLHTL